VVGDKKSPNWQQNKWYISGIYCQLGDYISPKTAIDITTPYYSNCLTIFCGSHATFVQKTQLLWFCLSQKPGFYVWFYGIAKAQVENNNDKLDETLNKSCHISSHASGHSKLLLSP